VRDKGLQLLTKAPTKPKAGEESRNLETKKSREIYQQGNFQIFPEQAKQIRLYAAKNNMKISEVVRLALEGFFKNHET
jgi:hypothetical protein